MDRVGDGPSIRLDLRRLDFGNRARARFELDDRVRLFEAGSKQPARAMIFEAAADDRHAVRHQRRGKRVARMAVQHPSRPLKCYRLAAIDAARRAQTPAAHIMPPATAPSAPSLTVPPPASGPSSPTSSLVPARSRERVRAY